ncbi:retrovirus-related pol polyprotein from transposon TNT 1-94 [Tanacetum coccineum]
MMGNRKLFSSYKAYNGGNVIFGSNLRGNIIGKGKISDDSLKIDNVEHVDDLRFNLLSIGQICDTKCRVTFSEHDSEITKDGKVIGHANMRLIQSLVSKKLVRNLPKLKFDQHFCDACKIRKQAHASHKAKNIVSTTRCLELLHMDLFGPSAVRSYGGNRYTLVIVDDYSRYTWTRFLKDKTEAFSQFKIFSKKIQNRLGCTIVSIRTDQDKDFDNEVQFGEFCNANGITHNFSAPRTPHSNGVVERKNRTLQEMSRTMFNEQSLPQKFWCNTVDTSTYILNRILIRAILGKTPYELLRGRKPTLDYFRVFRSKCFILNTKDYLTKKVEESLNVTFDETPPPSKTSPLVDDDLDEEEAIKVTEKKNLENDIEDETLEIDEIVNIKESRNHPLENSLDELAYGVPSEGPYQTNPPSPDDIILFIRTDREGQVTRIRHEQEIDVQHHQILTREIVSTLKPLEEIIVKLFIVQPLKPLEETIRENVFLFGGVSGSPSRHDRGTRRGRYSTSLSTFDQPSSSHLNDDDDDDGNDEGTSRASTPSPTRFVNSLTDDVPQVFQNPSNIDPHLEPFYTRQTKIINRQVQLRDEHRGGLRSIGKGLKNLWRNMKK